MDVLRGEDGDQDRPHRRYREDSG